MPDKTLIIAELGINHNGDPELAHRMIAAAAAAEVDVVKFHAYRADQVMTAKTPLADYMRAGAGEPPANFLELARKVELSHEALTELKSATENAGLEFLCSPFDAESTAFLASLGVKRLKLPSGELVNPYVLDAAAATRLPLIVSTGMATLDEVRWAVEHLRQRRSGPLALLHCLSQYPAECRYVNLRAMEALRSAFGLPVGYSDHTPGIGVAVAAVALGATIIEKHMTLDRNLPGPDHQASLTPDEFAEMVMEIRRTERALGDGTKAPAPPEIANRAIVRKSLVARQHLPAGTVLTPRHLTAKRPGTGIPAARLTEVAGRTLTSALEPDAMLREEDLD